MNKLTIDQLNVEGRKVFVRVDFNVPLDENQKITDLTRIKAALPTIRELLKRNARVILASHLGRPKGTINTKYSLRPVAIALEAELEQTVRFCPAVVGEIAKTAIDQVSNGECIIMENLRFYPGEEANDPDFCKEIISNVDLYVNDAFGTVHRAHASTEGIARFFSNAACGYLMLKELDALNKIMHHPSKPSTAIVGGAKIDDKILILSRLLEITDNILIGGGMAYSFLHVQGKKIGSSLLSSERLKEAEAILKKSEELGKQLFLPSDHVVADAFAENANTKTVEGDIPENWMGLDIGPKTVSRYAEVIQNSGTIFWNGPMGVFEMKPFQTGTFSIGNAMAEAKGETIIGGGDSVSAVNLAGLDKKMSHISTGGGAFLEYLEGKSLPGIDALADLV